MELSPGAHSFIEAVNGRELLAKAELRPDLAFVDARMPLMDGLTAIKHATAISPDTIWLLLTGYSEFEYAQTAMRLGVSDYLVKPIGTDQLVAVMEMVAQRRSKDLAVRSQKFQLELVELFYNWCSLPAGAGHEPCTYCVCVLFGEDDRLQSPDIRPSAAPALEGCCRAALFPLPTGERCLVLENPAADVTSILHSVREQERAYSAVWAEGITSQQDIVAVCEEITALSGLRIVTGLEGVRRLEEWKALPYRTQLLGVAQAVDQLCLAYLECNEVLYCQALSAWQAMPLSVMERVEVAAIKRYFQEVIQIRPDAAIADLAAWLEQLGKQIHLQKGKSGSVDLVAQIAGYVQQQYMKDIGVASIADSMGITPNYLSRIFRKQTGQKFIDYLSTVRIDAAKGLLDRFPAMAVKEVAERVGYPNSKHFSKVFSKLTEMNPSDYPHRVQGE